MHEFVTIPDADSGLIWLCLSIADGEDTHLHPLYPVGTFDAPLTSIWPQDRALHPFNPSLITVESAT